MNQSDFLATVQMELPVIPWHSDVFVQTNANGVESYLLFSTRYSVMYNGTSNTWQMECKVPRLLSEETVSLREASEDLHTKLCQAMTGI